MSTRNQQPLIWLSMLLVALLSAAGGFAVWRLTQDQPEASTEALLQLPEPRVIADFSLVDQDGGAFTLKGLQDRWSLLFFGFTHCPDICPSALYDLDQLDRKLKQSSRSLPPVQVVFFSVDPERDTPQQLKQYVGYFNPAFRGVTGEHVQLLPLTRQLGIAYRVEEHEAGQAAYQVDHSAGILLMNPEGRLHGVFPAPQSLEAMYRDLLRVLD